MDLNFHSDLSSRSQMLGLSEERISKCIASLMIAQFMERAFPKSLILRGGLAAQLHLNKRSFQRLSSDVDFYSIAAPDLDLDHAWGKFRSALLDCELIEDMVLRSSEDFQMSIPMISFDVAFNRRRDTILSLADIVKVDITFVSSSPPTVMVEPNILGLSIGTLIRIVSIESVVAEKLLKFAGEGTTFPSRRRGALAKQVYDLSNLLRSDSWSNDYEKIKIYFGIMLPRESAYRQRAISYNELLLMMQTGWAGWHEYLNSEQGWQTVRNFELEYVPMGNHVEYPRWLERSEQIKKIIEALVS